MNVWSGLTCTCIFGWMLVFLGGCRCECVEWDDLYLYIWVDTGVFGWMQV